MHPVVDTDLVSCHGAGTEPCAPHDGWLVLAILPTHVTHALAPLLKHAHVGFRVHVSRAEIVKQSINVAV